MTDARVVDLWIRAADSYETVVPYFQIMGERLVEQAQLQPHEHVLDVACGKGSSLIPAAAIAERTVGIDIAPAMVAALDGQAEAFAHLRTLRTDTGIPLDQNYLIAESVKVLQ